jgi:hypothetical protein
MSKTRAKPPTQSCGFIHARQNFTLVHIERPAATVAMLFAMNKAPIVYLTKAGAADDEVLVSAALGFRRHRIPA